MWYMIHENNNNNKKENRKMKQDKGSGESCGGKRVSNAPSGSLCRPWLCLALVISSPQVASRCPFPLPFLSRPCSHPFTAAFTVQVPEA